MVAELQGNSGLASGAGAVTGELAADIIREQLYGKKAKDLTEAEKENISALAQLATRLAVASVGGDVGDVSTGIAAGKNAVENNALAVPKAPGPLGLIEMLLRPSELGSGMLPVAVTTPQLVAETALISSLDLTEEEVKQYLNSLPSDTLSGLVVYRPEMTDDEYNASFSQAVIDLYNQTQNVISSNETSNGDKDKSQASASTQTGSGTVSGGASLSPDDDDKDKSKNDSSNNGDKKGVGGNGSASDLPNLDGMSPDEARKLLEKYGFDGKSTSPSGWQRFKGKDGSEVMVNWQSGRVVRTTAAKYGSKINSGQRLDAQGNKIPRNMPHDKHPTETIKLK